MRLTARTRQRMPLLCNPTPTFDAARERQNEAADRQQRLAAGRLRAALTRFETRHGADALIALLKTELEERGEARWRLDQLAPKPGAGGQSSILDAGR